MWEFRRGNTFGATAFSSYGGFWIGLGLWVVLVANPAVAAIKPSTLASTVASLNHDLGWILLAFAIFTIYLMILSTQVNLAVFSSSSSWPSRRSSWPSVTSTLAVRCSLRGSIKFGGYVGLLTALVAFYASAAGIAAAMAGRIKFPVGKPLIS